MGLLEWTLIHCVDRLYHKGKLEHRRAHIEQRLFKGEARDRWPEMASSPPKVTREQGTASSSQPSEETPLANTLILNF